MDKRALSPAAKAGIAAGTLLVGHSALKGMQQGTHNERQQQELIEQRKQDLSTPMFNPTMRKRAYDEFTATKLGAPGPQSFGEGFTHGLSGGPGPLSAGFGGMAGKALGTAIPTMLGHLLMKPVDWAINKADKALFLVPKQDAAFHQALEMDPMLKDVHAQNPALLLATLSTLRRFAPSIATDPNAVRAFLTHSVATGGNLDFATLKLLAETERMHKGKGLPQS